MFSLPRRVFDLAGGILLGKEREGETSSIHINCVPREPAELALEGGQSFADGIFGEFS